jgi:hypothetical protein
MKIKILSNGFKVSVLSNEGAELLSYAIGSVDVHGDVDGLVAEFAKFTEDSGLDGFLARCAELGVPN